MPIVGTIDTNCDPDNITLGIPANDDSIGSVKLLCNFIADAVLAGTEAVVSAEEMLGEAPAPAVELETEAETDQNQSAEEA